MTSNFRYVLNSKKLPYKTLHVEYPDLAGISERAGIPPYGTWPDGVTPFYTCPAITDDATGTALPDSYKIAEYLDKQYPDTPKAIPPGTEAFQAAFYAQFSQVVDPIWPFLVPRVPAILNDISVEYFIRTRTEQFGKPLVELEPVGEARAEAWAKLKANFGEMDMWLSKSPGQFFMGDGPTFADFVVAGLLQSMKVIFGENSEEWKDVVGWHDGRWNNLVINLGQYEGADN